MKLLYLLYFDLNNTEFYGVKKKIESQVAALKKLNIDVDIAYCKGNSLIIESDINYRKIEIKRGLSHYRFSIYNVLKDNINKWGYNNVYIRFPGSVDYFFFNTLKMLNEKNITTYLELPTYPIGGELKDGLKLLLENKKYIYAIAKSIIYTIHIYFSRRIYKYIENIVTFMPYEKIWNCNTICIDNAVDIDKFSPIEKKVYSPNELILLGVANVAKWHGFDRVIEGIGEYYKNSDIRKINIVFNIVGSGELISQMKKRVKELNIENNVKFLGIKQGNELRKEYEKCNIAISSLGMHRIGVLNGSTLKTKEYCAYGIPFVMAYNEKEIKDEFKYVLKFEANEDPIDINKIIMFYETLSKESNISEQMHNFAKKHYDWKIQMAKIFSVDYGDELCKH